MTKMKEVTKRFSISFEDLPMQATAPEFLSTPMDPEGAIESEVGPPALVKNLPFNGKNELPAYHLRAKRTGRGRRIPAHQFGKMYMGNAFAAFSLDVYPIPAVGTKLMIEPKMRAGQISLCNLYRNMRADAIYIIEVPTVLGMSGKFFIYAPESDENARTRGVYWQWSSSGYIVLYLPYSSDLPIQRRDVRRQGMSGLTLCIVNEIDNNSEGPVAPLVMNVWSAVLNIQATEYTQPPTASDVYVGLRFTPVKNPVPPPPQPKNPSWGYTQMDTGVDVSGGADVNEQESVRSNEPTQAVDPQPAEGLAVVPKDNTISTRSKKQTQSIGQKWVVFHTATIKSTDVDKEFTVRIDPKVRQAKGYKGEEVSRPFCRNQFVSGGRAKGYVTVPEITIRTTRSPYVAGKIQMSDSSTGFGNQEYITIGGADVLWEIMADQHANTAGLDSKYASQPWIPARGATFTFRYKVKSMNRTSEVNSIDITFSYRLGSAQFHVPRKAGKPDPPVLIDWVKVAENFESKDSRDLQALTYAMRKQKAGTRFAVTQAYEGLAKAVEEACYTHYNSDPALDGVDDPDQFAFETRESLMAEYPDAGLAEIFRAHGGDELVSTMIAPVAGEQPSDFITLTNQGSDDMIEQNENWQCIGNFDLPVDGTIFTIPIDLPVLADLYADDGDNPVTETFRRYAQVIPGDRGQLGPAIGQFVIQVRLPTSETANIAYVCVPGDMSEVSAEFFLGLGEILGLATSAIASVGGPILTTAFNMANAATGGIAKPLLGAAGSLIPPALGLVGKLINPPKKTPADVMAPIMGGDLPIGRFLNFLKPVMVNEREEPSLPTLALKVMNYLGSALPKVDSDGKVLAPATLPVSVYVHMGDAKVEREVFDRDVVYEQTAPAIWVTPEEGARLITKLVDRGRADEAYQLATLFAQNHFGENQRTINVRNITNASIDMKLIHDYYRALVSSPQDNPQGLF